MTIMVLTIRFAYIAMIFVILKKRRIAMNKILEIRPRNITSSKPYIDLIDVDNIRKKLEVELMKNN